MNKSEDKKFSVKYSDGNVRRIAARSKVVARAVARLHSVGRSFKLKSHKEDPHTESVIELQKAGVE